MHSFMTCLGSLGLQDQEKIPLAPRVAGPPLADEQSFSRYGNVDVKSPLATFTAIRRIPVIARVRPAISALRLSDVPAVSVDPSDGSCAFLLIQEGVLDLILRRVEPFAVLLHLPPGHGLLSLLPFA